MDKECLFVGGPLDFTWQRVELLGRPVEVPPDDEYQGEDRPRFRNTFYHPLAWEWPAFEGTPIIFYHESVGIKNMEGLRDKIQKALDSKALADA